MLRIHDLVFHIGGRRLFDRAELSLTAGEKVGLVGRNGSGKTTLLRIMSGELLPEAGEIHLSPRLTVGQVAQEAPSGDQSLIDTVLAADRERASLLAEAETCSEPARLADIHERLAAIGAEAAPSRAARILAGLGFDQEAQAQACASLSGGWRMRVALAALLFRAPDLLLLDEPTNHLDLEATLWLEGFLKSYPGMLMLISHDRDLLNAVPNRIIHLNGGRFTAYSGNYDRFERTRREQQARQAALLQRQMAQRRHMQRFIDRFRYKASKARQAQSRIKALERMEPIVGLVDEPSIGFHFPEPERLSPPLVTLEDVSAGYNEKTVLRGINLRLDPDDRIALLGANGNGKSTFIKLLARRLRPQSGQMITAPKLSVGYFAQHQTEELDLNASPLDHLARLIPNARDSALRSQLGRFGFAQERADVKAGALSGGEKARLLFALMSRKGPGLLLLDEPSNHLDVDAREALIQALADYPGAVVLVSHDPHLVGLVADRLWLVAEDTVTPYDGNLDDYRKLLAVSAKQQRASGQARPRATADDRKERRRMAAATRANLAPLRQSAKKAELAVEKLQRQQESLQTRLAEPDLYDGPAAAVTALQLELGEVEKALAVAEESWLAAMEALEGAQAQSGDPG